MGITSGYFSCDKVASLPNITLIFGNYAFPIFPEAFVIQQGISCTLGIITSGGALPAPNAIVLGQMFLRSYYTHFDRGNKRIGFAQAADLNEIIPEEEDSSYDEDSSIFSDEEDSSDSDEEDLSSSSSDDDSSDYWTSSSSSSDESSTFIGSTSDSESTSASESSSDFDSSSSDDSSSSSIASLISEEDDSMTDTELSLRSDSSRKVSSKVNKKKSKKH